MTTDAETAAKAETTKREERFERLFYECLGISIRDDQNNKEWFAIAWARAVEISGMYARQMGLAPPTVPASPVAALPAAVPQGVVPGAALPPGGIVSTPDFSTQPAAGPGGPVPMPSSDYTTAPAVHPPAAGPAAAPAGAPAAAVDPAAQPATAPASVFGPQFQGWPAVELEGILHAAQGWSLCREGNGTPEQFEAALKDVTTALEALAQRRIAMMLERQGQGS